MIIASVLLIGLCPVLLLIGFGVMSSKGQTMLNFVPDLHPSDQAAFNTRAGSRILLLAVAAAGLGAIGFVRPELGVAVLIGFPLLVIFTVIWILLGTSPSLRPKPDAE